MIDWLEIPVLNLERAMDFYTAILDVPLAPIKLMPGYRAAFITAPGPTTDTMGITLVEAADHAPSGYKGCRLYFRSRPDMDTFLMRIADAGGNIVRSSTQMDQGRTQARLAYFLDTEGNVMGAYAPAPAC